MEHTVIDRVHGLLLGHMPATHKKTASGWQTFSCPLCTDRRKRAGIITDGAKISFHCFNCPAETNTTGWVPGYPLSKKFKRLAAALGAEDSEIHAVQLLLLKYNEFENDDEEYTPQFTTFNRVTLPKHIDVNDLPDDHEVKQYAIARKVLDIYPCLYFPEEDYFEQRLVLPFYYKDEVVGWTGRHVNPPKKSTPKYLNELQPGYVFNIDKFLNDDRKIVIVCEGFIDAIQVDGIAVIGNTITPEQAVHVEKLNKRVIVCPDRNKAGHELIKQAMLLDWEVSFPPWEGGIVDAADASSKYGRLATVESIIKYAITNKTKIEVMMNLMGDE